MAKESKDALRVEIRMRILGVNGYTETTLHEAELKTTGPIGVPAAIEEAKNLMSATIRSTREAVARAESERKRAEAEEAGVSTRDPNEIPF